MSTGTLGSNRESYRRGVVLGLSMAELLLIFFCIFLMLFSIKVKSLNEQVAALQRQVDAYKVLQVEPDPQGRVKLPENWDELVLADQTVRELEGKGVDVDGLNGNLQAVAAVQAAARDGGTTDAELAAFVEALPKFGAPLPSDWDEVVLAYRVLEQLQQEGLDPSDLSAAAPLLGAWWRLRDQGYTEAQVIGLLETLPNLGKPLPSNWEDLFLALQQVDTARRAGVPLDRLPTDPRLVGVLAELQSQGMKIDDIVAALGELPDGAGGPSKTPQGQWPPMIPLQEADGYSFQEGSAELSNDFKRLLRLGVVDRIIETIRIYDVDVIEVTGHTDDQSFFRSDANIDSGLLPVLRGELPINELIAADNAGLGLARALAVVVELKKDPRLAKLTIIPLSAAYLVGTNGQVVDEMEGEEASRRRIEIRLRKGTTSSQ